MSNNEPYRAQQALEALADVVGIILSEMPQGSRNRALDRVLSMYHDLVTRWLDSTDEHPTQSWAASKAVGRVLTTYLNETQPVKQPSRPTQEP